MVTRRTAQPVPDATDLRQRILEASEQLLESEGLAALSMREVARRSGVTHQAPYHHFADRETILAELVRQGFEELTRRLARANARHADGDRLTTVTESAQAYVGFAIDHPGLFRIMFRAEVCDPTRFPAAQTAGQLAYQELEKMVALIHGAHRVASLAILYWGQVHGLASLIVDGPIGRQHTSVRERRAYARQVLSRYAHVMLGLPLSD